MISACVVAPDVEVIEGADILDVVAPVSKLTGHRENPLKLLGKITGADSALLNQVLQELPVIKGDPRLSDEDRVNAIVDRLSTGTPAEDALMAERLMADIEALGLSSEQSKVDSSSIEFNSSDAPQVES